MKLNDALNWLDTIEQDASPDVCCYITKQPIVYQMKLKCGHTFEYNALYSHYRKTQMNISCHNCPYCRSCIPMNIPYNEEALNMEHKDARYRNSYFKNNYLKCSYQYKSGKQKNMKCTNCAHYFKRGIYCFKHEKQLANKEEKKASSKETNIVYCSKVLKNGNTCKCKMFDVDTQLCKRHYNLKNNQLNKNE